MHIGRGRRLSKAVKALDLTSRWTSGVVGSLLKVNAGNFVAPISVYLKWIQTGWLPPALLVLTPLLIGLRRWLDRSRYDAVHDLLDQMCEHIFKNTTFEHEQHRRVTLFKRRALHWKWPFVGPWLVPIERSGEATRKTDALFRVPDDGEQCEGVAGRTYSKRKIVYVERLPDLRVKASSEDLQNYASRSFLDPKKMNPKRYPQACSLMGFPIDVDKKRWGVLVIDSVHPSFSQNKAKMIFTSLAPSLTSYLKGV